MTTVHIIGAGISGLSAATLLAEKHVPVKLYEASAHAGGRCRSTAEGDSGLHLIGAGDREIAAYLERIGAEERFKRAGALPLPRAPLVDYLPFLGWLAGRGRAEALVGRESLLRDAWLAPFARARLGTRPEMLPAKALQRFFRRFRPGLSMAGETLSDSFIAPALDYLEYRGGSVYYGHALTRIERADGALKSLVFARKKVALAATDIVILATPPAFTATQLGLEVPQEAHSAITLHFAVEHQEPDGVAYPIEEEADLLRYRPGKISASIRLADHCWVGDEAQLAQRIWRQLQRRHPYLEAMPDYSSRREKRAGHTISDAPPVETDHGTILLAGDWLDPLAPASLEAAAKSGHAAAQLAMSKLPKRREGPRQREPLL